VIDRARRLVIRKLARLLTANVPCGDFEQLFGTAPFKSELESQGPRESREFGHQHCLWHIRKLGQDGQEKYCFWSNLFLLLQATSKTALDLQKGS